VTESLKVWLVQDIVAPYRIRLFDTIARTPGIDFRLIILAPRSRVKPQWVYSAETLPFPAELVPGWHFFLGYSKRFSLNPRLFLRMMTERPDVVICAGYSFATIQTFLYKLLTGKEYVIWMEGTKITEGTRRPRFLRRWQRIPLTRMAGALIDAGTESHRYLKSLLRKDRHPPFFRSFNAVDNDYISSEARRFAADTQAFTAFKSRFAPKNILFVGQLIERKGVPQLLEAYRVIRERSREPIGLIMLGSGPLLDLIQAIKERQGLEHLYIEGFINQDIYPRYLAVADLLLLPSLHDPNPLVVFEALAAGKPIVLSERAGNAADFVDEGRNGYVVDPLDIEGMAEKALAILNSAPDEREAMARRSHELVKVANYDDSAKGFVDAARCAVMKAKRA
jgi:glycosyltransferase involved in cell wall biosynthesis